MKNIINLLFIAILALSSASCTDKDESSDKKKLEDAKSKYIMEIALKTGSVDADFIWAQILSSPNEF